MKDAAVPALRDVLHHSKKKSSQRMNAIGATLSRKLIKKSKGCMMCFKGGDNRQVVSNKKITYLTDMLRHLFLHCNSVHPCTVDNDVLHPTFGFHQGLSLCVIP